MYGNTTRSCVGNPISTYTKFTSSCLTVVRSRQSNKSPSTNRISWYAFCHITNNIFIVCHLLELTKSGSPQSEISPNTLFDETISMQSTRCVQLTISTCNLSPTFNSAFWRCALLQLIDICECIYLHTQKDKCQSERKKAAVAAKLRAPNAMPEVILNYLVVVRRSVVSTTHKPSLRACRPWSHVCAGWTTWLGFPYAESWSQL